MQIAAEPHAWHVFSLFISVGLLSIGTWSMTSTCYKPSHASAVGCFDNAGLFQGKWAFIFTSTIFFIVVAIIHAVVSTVSRPCGGRCASNDASMFVAFGVCIAITSYAVAAHNRLEKLPRSEIAGRPLCVVCPDASDAFLTFILWLGVATIWIGFIISVFIYCLFSDAVKRQAQRELQKKLSVPQDQNAGQQTESNA